MSISHSLFINHYDYLLPDEKIARYPLTNRDEAKLLLYSNNEISEHSFYQLADFLQERSLLIFNNAKVIPARLFFQKSTGAIIEVFCLEPADINSFSQDINYVYWKCFVGNNKRWKEEHLSKTFSLQGKKVILSICRKEQVEDTWIVEFSWNDTSITFFEILEYLGQIPLPPYLKRKTEEQDKETYQTIYAKEQGSVAAPTAGLHFTGRVFELLQAKNISTNYVTLHVGAGTFKPVTAQKVEEHYMHTEKVSIHKNTIQHLIDTIGNPVVSVGTTSVRVLESLYWYGVKLLVDKDASKKMSIHQWDPYSDKYNCDISPKDSLNAVLKRLETDKQETVYGETQLMIVPGYQFRIITGLLTNFHQPKSTLLLLVSALIGEHWKEIYNYALANNFRFLSYGDCCLFLK